MRVCTHTAVSEVTAAARNVRPYVVSGQHQSLQHDGGKRRCFLPHLPCSFSRQRSPPNNRPYPVLILCLSLPSSLPKFCGHAMHYSCFDQYYATVVQISDSHNDVALDVKRGEFHCPLCKAVGNLMVSLSLFWKRLPH